MGKFRNVTLTVNEETYREARAWCARRDTCVSRVVQTFLNRLPQIEDLDAFLQPKPPDLSRFEAILNELKSNPESGLGLRLRHFL